MAKVGERGVLFGAPDRGKHSPVRTGSGRPCDFPDCPTVLSTYNSSNTCWLHTDPSYRHALYRRR